MKSSWKDIHEIIRDYSVGRGKADAGVLEKFGQTIRTEGRPARFRLSALMNDDAAALLASMAIEFIRAWPSRGKGKVAEALSRFFVYLRKNHEIPVNADDLPRNIQDLTQRRLDMLRYLHTPRTPQEMEARYLVSERTLRDDLNALEDGWQVMGNTIRIKRTDSNGTVSYNSTAHPLLLALNLTEVYALAIGFPQLAKGSAYEDIAEYLSRAVMTQLSDYARGILAKSTPGSHLAQALEDGLVYRAEQGVLEKSRQSLIVYLIKQGMRCRIQYSDEDGSVHTLEGIPEFHPDDWALMRIGGQDIDIPIDRIIRLERLEPYR
ncbi:MAG: hypothetical protein PHP02_06800 [Eubacteriales bacterium]|nr:hypothetical protein [Eubacteriales bacterium]